MINFLAITAAIKLLLSVLDKSPVKVPKRWKPVLSIGLGVLGGIVDAAAMGTPWRQAILSGMSGLAAIGVHEGQEAVTGRRWKAERPTPPSPPPGR